MKKVVYSTIAFCFILSAIIVIDSLKDGPVYAKEVTPGYNWELFASEPGDDYLFPHLVKERFLWDKRTQVSGVRNYTEEFYMDWSAVPIENDELAIIAIVDGSTVEKIIFYSSKDSNKTIELEVLDERIITNIISEEFNAKHPTVVLKDGTNVEFPYERMDRE
ncbi:hypothetical protein [Alkalihalobacillus pseudalcaliphilus]|uniref:hypothetical protein n=1 Tax=Alkalihalobacillus pseudalcaliphilus TaxID=79884 RepID=UPI00064D8AB3|nr:hypothetical protein [Alkalihalobacillus pseudalcaliphilus]KMK76336.1 hypothetical protein AB990_14115 [Alkalihalobacillus pseudalcaliphilus]